MTTELVKVNDTQIECPYENGQHYVAVRSVCQALGIDFQKQSERIKSTPVLKDVYTDTVYASDKTGTRKQKMICLPLKYIFGWLFSIDETKVSALAFDGFMKYKEECYSALYDHFYMRTALYEKKEQLLAAKVDDIEKAQEEVRLANEKLKNAKLDYQVLLAKPVTQLQLDLN